MSDKIDTKMPPTIEISPVLQSNGDGAPPPYSPGSQVDTASANIARLNHINEAQNQVATFDKLTTNSNTNLGAFILNHYNNSLTYFPREVTSKDYKTHSYAEFLENPATRLRTAAIQAGMAKEQKALHQLNGAHLLKDEGLENCVGLFNPDKDITADEKRATINAAVATAPADDPTLPIITPSTKTEDRRTSSAFHLTSSRIKNLQQVTHEITKLLPTGTTAILQTCDAITLPTSTPPSTNFKPKIIDPTLTQAQRNHFSRQTIHTLSELSIALSQLMNHIETTQPFTSREDWLGFCEKYIAIEKGYGTRDWISREVMKITGLNEKEGSLREKDDGGSQDGGNSEMGLGIDFGGDKADEAEGGK